MFHRMGWVAVALVAVVTISAPSLLTAGSGKNNKAGKVEGTLAAVTVSSVAIQPRVGAQVTLVVNGSTKIELNERRAALASIPLGSKIEAEFDPATGIATKIEGKTP